MSAERTALGLDTPASQYFHFQPSDGAIGFDGLGAVDLDESEVEVDFEASEAEMAGRDKRGRMLISGEMRPRPTTGLARIVMRRAVKEFDFLYEEPRNALLVSERAYAEIGPMIASSLREVTPVECVFGKRTGSYMFGNLRLHRCWRTCIDYPRSSYKLVPGRKLITYDGSVEGGVDPLEHDPLFQVETVSFRDIEDFKDTQRRIRKTWFLPQTLTLHSDQPQAIFSIGPREEFVARPVAEALHRLKRPKSKVLGMQFRYPLVRARFEASAPEKAAGT